MQCRAIVEVAKVRWQKARCRQLPCELQPLIGRQRIDQRAGCHEYLGGNVIHTLSEIAFSILGCVLDVHVLYLLQPLAGLCAVLLARSCHYHTRNMFMHIARQPAAAGMCWSDIGATITPLTVQIQPSRVVVVALYQTRSGAGRELLPSGGQ